MKKENRCRYLWVASMGVSDFLLYYGCINFFFYYLCGCVCVLYFVCVCSIPHTPIGGYIGDRDIR